MQREDHLHPPSREIRARSSDIGVSVPLERQIYALCLGLDDMERAMDRHSLVTDLTTIISICRFHGPYHQRQVIFLFHTSPFSIVDY